MTSEQTSQPPQMPQTPIAQGSFAQTPFPNVLMYLLEKEMSGTLHVEGKNHSAKIYFRDGTPVKAQTSVAGRRLG